MTKLRIVNQPRALNRLEFCQGLYTYYGEILLMILQMYYILFRTHEIALFGDLKICFTKLREILSIRGIDNNKCGERAMIQANRTSKQWKEILLKHMLNCF